MSGFSEARIKLQRTHRRRRVRGVTGTAAAAETRLLLQYRRFDGMTRGRHLPLNRDSQKRGEVLARGPRQSRIYARVVTFGFGASTQTKIYSESVLKERDGSLGAEAQQRKPPGRNDRIPIDRYGFTCCRFYVVIVVW